MALLRILLIAYYAASVACSCSAFVPSSSSRRRAQGSSQFLLGRQPSVLQHRAPTTQPKLFLYRHSSPSRIISSTKLHESQTDSEEETTVDSDIAGTPTSCWNPNLRKQLATLASIGVLETAYLTYDKLQYSKGSSSSLVGALCSTTGSSTSSCTDVLHGPYASLHLGGIDVPLSALGMAAYTFVLVLAILPLLSPSSNSGEEAVVMDDENRIALLGGTTLMGAFSIYLVSLLLGVLHASCLFCFVSAGLSVTMAGLSWFGGMLPDATEEGVSSSMMADVLELRKRGATLGASSVGVATIFALGLFLGVSDDGSSNFDTLAAASSSSKASSSGTLLASAGGTKNFQDNVPPPITTKSSKAALALASDMKALNSRMFGAFWCSHCYDQKQALGLEAMQSLPYIECDREGYNNQRDLCRELEVPGYPTWEIGGELFPGERSVEELREIVDDVKYNR